MQDSADGQNAVVVSVIIPLYNNQDKIEKCLNSILHQTYKNYEIIVVDDGSTDGGGRICDEYSQIHEAIRVIHIKNQGPAMARKIGIQNAIGEYLMFVDSDDWLTENALELLEYKIKDCDMVCAQMIRTSGKELLANSMEKTGRENLCCTRYEICYQFFGERKINGSLSAKLFSADLFREIDYCESAIIGEDIVLIIQLLDNCSRVKVISDIVYYYYKNTNGISRSGYTDMHGKGLHNYIWIKNRLKRQLPELTVEIDGFFYEYEMAVITAMCRNNQFDKSVIRLLRDDLRGCMREIWKNKVSPFYMKVSAGLIAYFPNVFIVLFRILHCVTGR